ncbi:hypothetical protein CERZMDRAFT_101619 [Cercospora zeae-maydis SCOH1-5]|uniref:RING-type domain-containing protein n=1 Tax=Cercospora zeae-maydis SCOH1-5 TaxID=717836 RepID=A0A6A6F2J1_9PEZI|nr:hypothetical protein CERZMDRAFT_101619 [Cercospora zeae-maydis SCOH1-5]
MSHSDQRQDLCGAVPEPKSLYECIACGDTLHLPSAAVIHGLEFCQQCFDVGIRPLFQWRLVNEFAPLKWHGNLVDIEDVQHQFSAAFISKFRERMIEYSVLPKHRVYCACHKFLGDQRELLDKVECPDCGSRTCTTCAELIDQNKSQHECTTQLDPLADLLRGADYQLCPKCDLRVELAEACNHMQCQLPACNDTSFCYTCGEQTFDDDRHWSTSRLCQRYGLPKPLRRMKRDRIAEGKFIQNHPTILAAREEVLRRRQALGNINGGAEGRRRSLLYHPDIHLAQQALNEAMGLLQQAFTKLEAKVLESRPVLKKRAALAPAIREAYLAGVSKNDQASLLKYPALAAGYADLDAAIAATFKEDLLAELLHELRGEN